MRKVYWRLLPIAIIAYFLAYLDRINVGFAALTMNKDLGIDAAVYGMAASAFFWGHFLFEVPSNIIRSPVRSEYQPQINMAVDDLASHRSTTLMDAAPLDQRLDETLA